MSAHIDIADADVAQARLFVVQLEDAATQLELQVMALEKSASMRQAKNAARLSGLARARRLELYEVRSYIDRLEAKFLRAAGA